MQLIHSVFIDWVSSLFRFGLKAQLIPARWQRPGFKSDDRVGAP